MINETNLRVALVRKGLSQNQLAKKLRLHPSTLSAVVRGYRKAEPQLRQRLADILSVSESAIFEDQSANQPS